MLFFGSIVTYFERYVTALAMNPIKRDLGLTDSQLGLLTGIAFALFFSLLGFPLARIADRGYRVRLIAVTIAISSLAVALCGAARSFTQLIVIRVGVAAGETGFLPAANSLVAGSFPRAERPKALSQYLLGGSVGFMIGYAAAGWLIEKVGWRVTFAVAGCPGAVLSILIWLTLRDHRTRSSSDQNRGARGPSTTTQSSLAIFFGTVWASKTFRQLMYSYTALSFVTSGYSQWLPTFFIRSFGASITNVGVWSALVFGTAGICGMFFGGRLFTRYAASREALQLRAMAVLLGIVALLKVTLCLSHSIVAAFAISGSITLLTSATSATFFSIVQLLTPDNMRAQATALLLLLGNLIGLGLGPLAVGALSDVMQTAFGADSLRYAVLAFAPGYVWCGWYLCRGARTVTCELANVDRSFAGQSRRVEAVSSVHL